MDRQSVSFYEFLYKSTSSVSRGREPYLGVAVGVSTDEGSSLFDQDLVKELCIYHSRLIVFKIR